MAQDRDKNEAAIHSKEEEIVKAKKLLAELEDEVESQKQRYEELYFSLDLCPYCEGKLVELRDVTEEDWTGSYRKYECGFTQLDGDTVLLCPHDSEYPKFEQVKLTTEYDEKRKKWSCRYSDISMKTWRLPMTVTHGKTEREAQYLMQIIHEGRLDDEPQREPQS